QHDDRGDHLLPVQRPGPAALVQLSPQRGQGVAERQKPFILGCVTYFPPERMIAILLAPAGIAASGLEMAQGVATDPYIPIGRGNGEGVDSLDNSLIANATAFFIKIGSDAVQYLAAIARRAVGDVMKRRRTPVWGFRGRRLHCSYISAAGTFGVAQHLHLVVVTQHTVVLTLNYLADILRQGLFQRLTVALLGHVLTTLTLIEDGLVILAGDQGFQINPATVQITAHAGAVLRVTAQTDHDGLQLLGSLGAAGGALGEQLLELGTLDVLGADAKAFFAVLAGLDQIVQGRNNFFGINGIHETTPAITLSGIQLTPRRRSGFNLISISANRANSLNSRAPKPSKSLGTAQLMRMIKMNAIELLKADHEVVKQLLEEISSTSERAFKKRAELLKKIEMELSVHTTIEEEDFYPAFKEAGAKEELKMYHEAKEEHRAVEALV